MKKSMIISTIAMIVVVVVALSTATYAWLTSASVTAANAQFTIAASGEFALAKGTVTTESWATGEGKGIINYETAENTIPIEDSTTKNGIFQTLRAPVGEMLYSESGSETKTLHGMKYNNTSGSVSIQGSKFVTGLATSLTDPTGTGKFQAGNEFLKPTSVRVDNISGATKGLKVAVLVKMNQNTEATKRAASALRFAVAYIRTSAPSTVNVWSSGYNYATNASFEADKTVLTSANKGATGVPHLYTAQELIDNSYQSKTIITTVTDTLSTLEKAANLSKDDKYFTYDMTISDVTSTEKVYLVFYTWLDGFSAGNEVNSCEIGLTYAFYAAS